MCSTNVIGIDVVLFDAAKMSVEALDSKFELDRFE